MTIREQFQEMPGERQIAWLMRTLLSLGMLAAVSISGYGYLKLDRLAEVQAAQTILITQSLEESRRARDRVDRLFDLHHVMADRVGRLEHRMQTLDAPSRMSLPADGDRALLPSYFRALLPQEAVH